MRDQKAERTQLPLESSDTVIRHSQILQTGSSIFAKRIPNRPGCVPFTSISLGSF